MTLVQTSYLDYNLLYKKGGFTIKKKRKGTSSSKRLGLQKKRKKDDSFRYSI